MKLLDRTQRMRRTMMDYYNANADMCYFVNICL